MSPTYKKIPGAPEMVLITEPRDTLASYSAWNQCSPTVLEGTVLPKGQSFCIEYKPSHWPFVASSTFQLCPGQITNQIILAGETQTLHGLPEPEPRLKLTCFCLPVSYVIHVAKGRLSVNFSLPFQAGKFFTSSLCGLVLQNSWCVSVLEDSNP